MDLPEKHRQGRHWQNVSQLLRGPASMCQRTWIETLENIGAILFRGAELLNVQPILVEDSMSDMTNHI